MIKLFIRQFSMTCAITTLFTQINFNPLCAMEQATNKEAAESSLSRLIKAEEIKDFSKTHGESRAFGLTIDGRFLKRQGQTLTFIKIKKDGSIKEERGFTFPTVENKTFFRADIISNRFVELEYGEPSEELALSSAVEDSNNESSHCYVNTESLIWDMDNSNYFKIDNPDFHECIWDIDLVNNPERLLVEEKYYKPEGDYQGQSRYRYYNLVTRQFLDPVVLDFQPRSISLITSTDEQGAYKFKYATQFSPYPSQYDFVKVYENQDGSLSIGEVLYSVYSNTLRYSILESVEDDRVILFQTAGDGLRVPYVLDLKRKKPMERPLLTEDEVDELESDVYDADIVDNLLIYKTHFEKRRFHSRALGPLGPKGKLLQDFFSMLGQEDININPMLDDLNIRGIIEAAKQLPEFIQKYPNLLSPQQENILGRVLSKNFITYFMNEIKLEISSEKLVPEHHATVNTADTRFKMPIYYTVPKSIDTTGWFMIDVHGGPHCREFNERDMDQQFWTSRGFPYLRLNIRGSTGFGTNYCNASDGKWYEVIDDVKMAIEWAKTNGLGTKAIVSGYSFGAYAAAAAYAKGYADVAIAINGLFDLNQQMERTREGKTCHTCQDLLIQLGNTVDSRKANSVTTHLTYRPGAKMLLMVGLKDNNCLPEQSESLYKQMVDLGNHVELITIADEGHTIGTLGNRNMIYRIQEQFLGDITGHPYEANGYGTLVTTPGVVYHRSSERAINN